MRLALDVMIDGLRQWRVAGVTGSSRNLAEGGCSLVETTMRSTVASMAVEASSSSPDVPIPFDACDLAGTFVFVSYAHADKVLAYQELLRIRSFGIRVWYDEGIGAGSEWPEAIANALSKAAAFVV